jgi:hypothetical protein
MKKTILQSIIVSLIMVFMFTGCEEPRHTQEGRRRSDGYYQRHHQTPPPRINVQIHN